MFNIFKINKPKLSEIIPSDFVDIHSHILPGLDDGAKDIDDFLAMINGIKIGILKNHLYSTYLDYTIIAIRQ